MKEGQVWSRNTTINSGAQVGRRKEKERPDFSSSSFNTAIMATGMEAETAAVVAYINRCCANKMEINAMVQRGGSRLCQQVVEALPCDKSDDDRCQQPLSLI